MIGRNDMGREQEEEAFKVSWKHGGEPCEVYFFKRWAGYSHPVRPVDPVTYRDALKLEGFCRVFLRDTKGAASIVFVQAIKIVREGLKLRAPSSDVDRYFAVSRAQGAPDLGKEALTPEAVMLDEFIHVMPRQKAQPAVSGVELVRNSVGYSYDYTYDGSGVLKRVVITNPEGQSVLDY
jgi:hypothetical protein